MNKIGELINFGESNPTVSPRELRIITAIMVTLTAILVSKTTRKRVAEGHDPVLGLLF